MSKANIDRVMEMLDPEECSRRYVMPNIMAREEYREGKSIVKTFDDMMSEAVRYYTYHFSRVICDGVTPPPEMARGTVWRLLDQHYKGGIQAANRAATRALNGGIYSVYDCIMDHFLKEQEEQYFNFVVMECCDIMDLDDVKALMEQYIRKYGRYLDGENMPRAEYLVPQYREVIKRHAQIVENVRMSFAR